MALTPNILMALEGLTAETALAIVPANTNNYLSQVIVADYINTIAVYQADLYVPSTQEDSDFSYGNPTYSGNPNGITQELIDKFIHRLDNSAPYISNAAPADASSTASYTKIFDQHVKNLFSSNQQFVLYALIAMGAVDIANKYVNAAKSAETLSSQTFTSSDALITGNLSAVTTDVPNWSEELAASGKLFNFAKLDSIGTPYAIADALIRVNMLGFISDELEANGLSARLLSNAINDNPDQVLVPAVQKRCYDAFILVTGAKLGRILEVLGFISPGITNLGDLLDLTKVFPETFSTITAPNGNILSNIYNTDGSLTTYTAALATPLIAVIPDPQAKANYAFTCSLSQLKGIRNSSPDRISATGACIEDNTGLQYTGNLTEPMPQSIIDGIFSDFGGGSGPNGTFYLSDLIGAPAALPDNSNIAIMDTNFNIVQDAGGFDDIAEVLEVMRDVIGRVYDVLGTDADGDDIFDYIEIPVPLPAAGIYTGTKSVAKTAALNALMVELDVAVAAYIAAYPDNHNALSTAFASSSNGIVAGIKELWDANVRFKTTYVAGYETNDSALDGLPPNKAATQTFAESLHIYGKKTDQGNIVAILEALATDTLGGNAIVAAMREGRNLDKLSDAGITGDNLIS
jgi:hypothetical protein